MNYTRGRAKRKAHENHREMKKRKIISKLTWEKQTRPGN